MTGGGVKVLTVWPSMYGLRVITALNEKGVEYEHQEEDLTSKSQLLLESNPVHKKIPVLLHAGRPVCESLIIVHYIDETWEGKGSFLPKDPYERALARFWADFVDNKLFSPVRRALWGPDGEAREQGKKDFTEGVATLDGALRDVFGGGGPLFGGHKVGLVDIALAPLLCWVQAFDALLGIRFPDEQRCPHLRAWMTCMVEQPSVKKTLLFAPPDKLVEWLRPLVAS